MSQLSSQYVDSDQGQIGMAQVLKVDFISRRSTLFIVIAIAIILRVGSALYLGNEVELDRALFKEGVKFIIDDPVRYILLSISRTREYFKFWPSSESGMVSNIERVGSFGILLPFMVYGVALNITLAWRKRDTEQGAAILLLLLFCVVYTGIHLLTWALIRYRLPVDAILVIFAASGLVDLARRTRDYLSSNRALAPG